MKTFNYSLVVSCIALVLSACGGGGSTSVDKPNASSSSSSGGVTAPAGKKTYRLDMVETYDVIDDDTIILKQRENFSYNADNNLLAQRIRTFHGDAILGQLALELDFSYDTVDTWQASVVTMDIYDSWTASGTGNLVQHTEWVDTWSGGKFVSNLENHTFYNTDTGEQTGEVFNQAFRAYTGDYNTLFEIDFMSDNSIDRTEERTWTSDGNLEWVFSYSGEYDFLMSEQLFSYDGEGLLSLHETYDHMTGESGARVYDFSDPTEVIVGKATGTDESNAVVEVELLIYKQAPCGRGLEERRNYDIEPIPRCFVK